MELSPCDEKEMGDVFQNPATGENPAAPLTEIHGTSSDSEPHPVSEEVDSAPWRAYGRVVCSGPSGWMRTKREEQALLKETRKLQLLTHEETREFHNAFRGSELIATALLSLMHGNSPNG